MAPPPAPQVLRAALLRQLLAEELEGGEDGEGQRSVEAALRGHRRKDGDWTPSGLDLVYSGGWLDLGVWSGGWGYWGAGGMAAPMGAEGRRVELGFFVLAVVWPHSFRLLPRLPLPPAVADVAPLRKLGQLLQDLPLPPAAAAAAAAAAGASAQAAAGGGSGAGEGAQQQGQEQGQGEQQVEEQEGEAAPSPAGPRRK